MELIDLHTHSTYSDGTLSPGELVDLARNTNLKAIALTDHDTLEGVGEALARGRQRDIEVIPGVEVSAQDEGKSVHILAYGVQDSHRLQQFLATLQEARRARNARIIANLNRIGIEATMADLDRYSIVGQVGRPHIARLLMDHGAVKSMDQAFSRYLKKGGLAYEENFKYTVEEVIDTICRTGGLAVLAHPANIDPSLARLPRILRRLKAAGLAGVEVYYPTHSANTTRELKRLAGELDLLLTGGSDFHGAYRAEQKLGGAGPLRVSYELLRAMKQHPSWSGAV